MNPKFKAGDVVKSVYDTTTLVVTAFLGSTYEDYPHYNKYTCKMGKNEWTYFEDELEKLEDNPYEL